MYARLLKPLLFSLDAEAAHELGLVAIQVLGAVGSGRPAETPFLRTRVAGLDFPNPVGLAAGLDKNAVAVRGLFSLGFGSVEVGTVTPRPQPGNDKPRLFRLPAHQALINRMGFNNEGADAMATRLAALGPRPAPVGVNIGKNKDTPLDRAVEDYVACATRLGPLADYVAVNLSSPNTPGLRQLQEPQALEALLSATRKVVTKPLFLKIAPDLSDEAIDSAVDVARSCKVDGLVCTNTTIERPVTDALCAEAGGFSGAPLFTRSTEVLRRAFTRAQGTLPLIGVGGIFSADDAWKKLSAGASLVQIYTGFIYGGPGTARRILAGLEQKLRETGLKDISQAVGRDA